MVGCGLVGHQNQPSIRQRAAYQNKGAEEHAFIPRPGRAGDECRRSAAESKTGIVTPHRARPGNDAIETRISQHSNPGGLHAKLCQADCVLRGDRGSGGDDTVARFQQAPSRPS